VAEVDLNQAQSLLKEELELSPGMGYINQTYKMGANAESGKP
jgi:hypothetical protein